MTVIVHELLDLCFLPLLVVLCIATAETVSPDLHEDLTLFQDALRISDTYQTSGVGHRDASFLLDSQKLTQLNSVQDLIEKRLCHDVEIFCHRRFQGVAKLLGLDLRVNLRNFAILQSDSVKCLLL